MSQSSTKLSKCKTATATTVYASSTVLSYSIFPCYTSNRIVLKVALLAGGWQKASSRWLFNSTAPQQAWISIYAPDSRGRTCFIYASPVSTVLKCDSYIHFFSDSFRDETLPGPVFFNAQSDLTAESHWVQYAEDNAQRVVALWGGPQRGLETNAYFWYLD